MPERDPNTGLFAKGNTLSRGHGNPLLRRMGQLRRQLIDSAADPERLKKVADELYAIVFSEKARALDKTHAAKVLFDTFLGKAPQMVDVTLDDGKTTNITVTDIMAVLPNDAQTRAKFAALIRQRRQEAITHNGNAEADD